MAAHYISDLRRVQPHGHIIWEVMFWRQCRL
jgi:hypothetical protein